MSLLFDGTKARRKRQIRYLRGSSRREAGCDKHRYEHVRAPGSKPGLIGGKVQPVYYTTLQSEKSKKRSVTKSGEEAVDHKAWVSLRDFCR